MSNSIYFKLTYLQAVRNQITEAQKIASGSGSEQDIAEAKIELEVPHVIPLRVRRDIADICQILESLQPLLK